MANADVKFGISGRKSGDLHIGDKPITLIEGSNDIQIDDNVYKGTPGLWELLIFKHPDETKINDNDYAAYEKILFDTKATYQPGSTTKPNSSGGYKYVNFIKPIWANRDKTALAQEEAYKEAEQMHAATPKKKGKCQKQ